MEDKPVDQYGNHGDFREDIETEKDGHHVEPSKRPIAPGTKEMRGTKVPMAKPTTNTPADIWYPTVIKAR